MQTQKVVITGGPCTGKSTIIDALGNLGYTTVPETARMIIEEELKKPEPERVVPWTDMYAFEINVIDRQLELERRLNGEHGFAFLDRSIVDTIPFFELDNIPMPKRVTALLQSHRYDRVFLLNRLPSSAYENDKVRKEDPVTARMLHERITQSYLEAGYTLIPVPVLPIEQRAAYIINKLGGNGNGQYKNKDR